MVKGLERMAIKEFELYHGAVLAKILRKDIPTSLKLVETNRDSSTYVINDNIALYMTYRSLHKSSNEKISKWFFDFSLQKCREIKEFLHYDLYFTLICINSKYEPNYSEVCLINKESIKKLIDLDAITVQKISVFLENGKSFRVHGTMSKKSKELTVSRNQIDNIEIPN